MIKKSQKDKNKAIDYTEEIRKGRKKREKKITDEETEDSSTKGTEIDLGNGYFLCGYTYGYVIAKDTCSKKDPTKITRTYKKYYTKAADAIISFINIIGRKQGTHTLKTFIAAMEQIEHRITEIVKQSFRKK